MKFPRATRLLMIFAREDDARRVMEVLPKRMAKHGRTVHPEKTRLVDFRSPRRDDPEVPEGSLRPPQEGVPLAVSGVLVLDVSFVGARGAECVDLHRVVDDEVDGHLRVDA